MKSSIFITSVLATGVFAWPKPQLLDLNLGLGGKVTVFSTVTVTKPAATCIPIATPSIPGLPPVVIGGPGSPNVPTSKPAPVVPPPVIPLPQITSKPVVVPSLSKPAPLPSTTLAPIQVPSIPGRITGALQASLSVGLSYQAAILYHHNVARANHGAAALIWDASCAANALAAANTCNYARYMPAGVNQGQNRYLSTSNEFNVTAAITEAWYKNEFSAAVPWFGIASLPISLLGGVEDLTQLLWKGTTRVGCASVDCGARMRGGGATGSSNKYTVCNYAAAGNIGGLFAINVGRPISTTNLGRWTD